MGILWVYSSTILGLRISTWLRATLWQDTHYSESTVPCSNRRMKNELQLWCHDFLGLVPAPLPWQWQPCAISGVSLVFSLCQSGSYTHTVQWIRLATTASWIYTNVMSWVCDNELMRWIEQPLYYRHVGTYNDMSGLSGSYWQRMAKVWKVRLQAHDV